MYHRTYIAHILYIKLILLITYIHFSVIEGSIEATENYS